MTQYWEKDISGCGITGLISKKKRLIEGDVIIRSLVNMTERGNGLGSGYAGYGIYPDFPDHYALHIIYDDEKAKQETEHYLKAKFKIDHDEPMPIRENKCPGDTHPIIWRYFATPLTETAEPASGGDGDCLIISDDDFVSEVFMHININIEGAFVYSSGKNMGVFKGVGFPEEMAEFFRVDDYKAYIWTAHNRFPTNTPGWWGGAHPFSLLDWTVVHNGEITSYGINKRYLESFGYICSLYTDTEVVAYMLDLLVRRHGLDLETAAAALAPQFWDEIGRMPDGDVKELKTALRMTYGSAALNGPFAILVAGNGFLMGLNDRIKLRPLLAATKDDMVYLASEEAAIREMEPNVEKIWAPKAGAPMIIFTEE